MEIMKYYKIKNMSPQLLVADINNSIEFYTQKLGFNVDFLYEDFYAGITKDGFSIHLKANKPFIEAQENMINQENLKITLSVDDIENLYKDLQDKSVTISQSLRNMPYGKEFYVADPDNNIIAFLEV